MDYEYLFMTKSATAPFHCGVHPIRPPQALPSSLDFHLNSSASTAGEPSGPERRKLRLIKNMERQRPCQRLAGGDHGVALDGRGKPKNTRKIDISENRYDVRIVKAEARGPTRSVFSGRPGDVKRSPPLHDRLQLGFRRRSAQAAKEAKRKAG